MRKWILPNRSFLPRRTVRQDSDTGEASRGYAHQAERQHQGGRHEYGIGQAQRFARSDRHPTASQSTVIAMFD